MSFHGRSLLRCGVGVTARGDRIILFAENQPEWGIAYLAAVQIGVIVVPIDPQTAEEEIFALAEYTEAKAILTSETCMDRLHGAQTEPSAESAAPEFLNINRFCQPFEGGTGGELWSHGVGSSCGSR